VGHLLYFGKIEDFDDEIYYVVRSPKLTILSSIDMALNVPFFRIPSNFGSSLPERAKPLR